MADFEYGFSISLELLDLIQNGDEEEACRNLLVTLVKEEDNTSLSCSSSVLDNASTPKTRAMVLLFHKVLALPRASKFIKAILNILAMAEENRCASDLKVPTTTNTMDTEGSEVKSGRWRQLESKQKVSGRLRRSKRETISIDDNDDSIEPTTSEIVATNQEKKEAPPVLVDVDKTVLESKLQESFQVDGPNKDVWESKMRPPVNLTAKVGNQILFPGLPVASTAPPKDPVPTNIEKKPKSTKLQKKVPYAEHQVMLPSNFFRYPILDLSARAQTEKFVTIAPTSIPEWFSIRMAASQSLQGLYEDDQTSISVPLSAALFVYQSSGNLLVLLESILCQSLFRLFSKNYGLAEGYQNYIELLVTQFPWFAISSSSSSPTKAEIDFYSLEEQRIANSVTVERYTELMEQFIFFRDQPNRLQLLMESVEQNVFQAIRSNDLASLSHLERILISLLGNIQSYLRERASVLLNCVYDRHTWQLQKPFSPVIRCIGDAFSIEIECSEGSLSGDVLRELFIVVAVPTKEGRALSYHIPVQHGNSLIVELPLFTCAGYFDWAIGFDKNGVDFTPLIDVSVTTQWAPIVNQLSDIHGRFIVQPQVREDIFHEVFVDIEGAIWDRVHGGPIRRYGNFDTISRALDDYCDNDGITALYIMGAQERAEFGRGNPFGPIDRAAPNSASGGESQFSELITLAKAKGIKIIVDSTARVSLLGTHRKYRGLDCHTLDENGLPQVTIATDGAEQTWKDCKLLNYRKKENWDLYISDVQAWATRGVRGVRIESAHCCPLILKPDTKEMERMDSDATFHYDLQEIMDGDIVLPSSNEAYTYGYYGTKAYKEGYPNPFFIKMTSTIWQSFPDFVFVAESYWERKSNALISGLIPFSTGLSQALKSVFGTGFQQNGTIGHLDQRSDVKAFYDWYEMERTSYPQNSILIYESSNHYSPYPVALYGRGAWNAVDLLFFLPEIPATYVGEHGGWSMEYNLKNSSFHHLENFRHSPSLGEIRGHYVHRANMRKKISVLQNGGLILLYAKLNATLWHDRVFAFARFKLNEMAIIAINFNDVESTFYIDFSPLRKLFASKETIYKRVDYINPQVPPMYFSLDELLHEKQQVTLQPYTSMCWGIFTEIDSPAARRVLFEHSFYRLADNLDQGVDPAYNLVYSDFCESFSHSIGKFDAFIESLTNQLPPPSLQRFPTLIRNALVVSGSEECKLIATLEYLKEKKDILGDNGSTAMNIYKQILDSNNLGPLVFVTPEIGRFSKVGGIAVMVNELTEALVALGCEVIVISPYYNFDRKGKTGYLAKEGVTHLQNIVAFVGNEPIEVGIHMLKENGITYYFIHHFDYFPTPYHAGPSMHQLKTIVLMAKASLELCCQLRILPAIVITNDWFTGLVPAYGRKSSAFGTTFEGATFFHLVHNLEEGYEGKIYLDGGDHLGYIHHLPRDIVVDPTCNQLCLNASRCALLSCNQWGTVSKSYCQDLMQGINPSPLRYYLAQFPTPFAHSNGIRVIQRQEQLDKVASSHEEAKELLQKKYFSCTDPDIPLFSFVGRICLQKGVHLILQAVSELIGLHNGKLQIIVGGMANYKDPYAAQCAWTMQGLRSTYPDTFWADPNEFFTDGPLLNLGSDFALMPSLFEPSGVVQQEYFLGGTPVIAFKTGGLKDTVFEGEGGNGFTFEAHTHVDYVQSINRAIQVFTKKEEYAALRVRAKASVLDMADVAQAWAKEFSRLRKCIWVNQTQMQEELAKLKHENPLPTKPSNE